MALTLDIYLFTMDCSLKLMEVDWELGLQSKSNQMLDERMVKYFRATPCYSDNRY